MCQTREIPRFAGTAGCIAVVADVAVVHLFGGFFPSKGIRNAWKAKEIS